LHTGTTWPRYHTLPRIPFTGRLVHATAIELFICQTDVSEHLHFIFQKVDPRTRIGSFFLDFNIARSFFSTLTYYFLPTLRLISFSFFFSCRAVFLRLFIYLNVVLYYTCHLQFRHPPDFAYFSPTSCNNSTITNEKINLKRAV